MHMCIRCMPVYAKNTYKEIQEIAETRWRVCEISMRFKTCPFFPNASTWNWNELGTNSACILFTYYTWKYYHHVFIYCRYISVDIIYYHLFSDSQQLQVIQWLMYLGIPPWTSGIPPQQLTTSVWRLRITPSWPTTLQKGTETSLFLSLFVISVNWQPTENWIENDLVVC